jgi:hypothetical protein
MRLTPDKKTTIPAKARTKRNFESTVSYKEMLSPKKSLNKGRNDPNKNRAKKLAPSLFRGLMLIPVSDS